MLCAAAGESIRQASNILQIVSAWETQNAPTPRPTTRHSCFDVSVALIFSCYQAKKAQEAELSALFDEALLTGVKKVQCSVAVATAVIP